MWRMLDEPGDLIATRSPAEVSAALEHLLVNRGVNALAIVGGDGTIHSVLNALWPLLDALETQTGQRVVPPPFLLLHGGTMNMASRAMETKTNPLRAIARFLEHARGQSVESVNVKQVGVMSVTTGSSRLHGLIFGSELVHNALEMHRLFGNGYRGLLALLTHVGVGSWFGTRTWERHSHLLNAPKSSVVVDDVTYARYGAAVASTVDLKLVKGWVHSLRLGETSDSGFHAKILLEAEQMGMIRMLPTLLRNGRDPRIVDVEEASRLAVKGGFTLDGELYPQAPDAPVSVTLHPRRMRCFHSGGNG
jgi:diacylglycerol kinase family enzyme